MMIQTLSYFLTAFFAGTLLIECTKGAEISQDLLHEIIQDVLTIVYGNPVFEKTTCSEPKTSKLYYYLYTPQNKVNATRLHPDDGQSNDLKYFDPSLGTKFLTHGWLGEVNGSWPEDIKNAYLKKGNYNVILLDWSEYATNRYSKSSCYVNRVANVTARLMVHLKNNASLDLNKTHLIGHSLGGQMAGIIGQFIQNFTSGEKVKRVTGLDAAGPLFCSPEKDYNRRITADDAQFVDGIHTNDGEFGCKIEYAQVNFYPNCGSRQAGCIKANVSLLNITGSFKEFFGKISCSHGRAHDYWLESILENDLPSKSCSSCLSFQTNLCSSNLEDNMLGEYAFKSNNKKEDYYLKTNSKAPFGDASNTNILSQFFK